MKAYLNLFTILGLLLLAGAGIAYKMGADLRERAELTTGTVTGFRVSVDSEDNSETYCPQVRYNTSSGQQYTYNSNFCSSPPGYDVGEQVEIYYDPADPEEAQIKGFWSQYLLVTIFGCIGLPFTVLGIWAGIPSRSNPNDNTKAKAVGPSQSMSASAGAGKSKAKPIGSSASKGKAKSKKG